MKVISFLVSILTFVFPTFVFADPTYDTLTTFYSLQSSSCRGHWNGMSCDQTAAPSFYRPPPYKPGQVDKIYYSEKRSEVHYNLGTIELPAIAGSLYYDDVLGWDEFDLSKLPEYNRDKVFIYIFYGRENEGRFETGRLTSSQFKVLEEMIRKISQATKRPVASMFVPIHYKYETEQSFFRQAQSTLKKYVGVTLDENDFSDRHNDEYRKVRILIVDPTSERIDPVVILYQEDLIGGRYAGFEDQLKRLKELRELAPNVVASSYNR
jgi:hypothetical protein